MNLPPAPKMKPRRWPWILGMLVSLLVGIAIGASAPDEEPAPVAAPQATTAPEVVEPSPTPEPPPTTEAFQLTKSDIEVSLKTTERQCFGSAGCLVTVEIRLALDRAMFATAPQDAQWDITYQISGDESGPIIGTFSLYGDGKYDVNEELVSTPSTHTPVGVKVLDVERF